MSGKSRGMVGEIVALSWPTVVEQALQTVVQFADSAMVGRIGAQASASVGMTTSVTWLVNAPLFAMGVGVLATIARASGAGDTDTAKRAASQSILLALVIGVCVGALTLAVSPFLPTWLGADPALHADGAAYFAIICAPMLFRASIVIFGSVLRAVGDMKTPMAVNLAVNAINVVLNYFLIYETHTAHLGPLSLLMPGAGWGVRGAAAATAVSYVAGGVAMFLAMMHNRKVSPRGIPLRLDKRIMGDCVRIGAPVALSRVGACLGQVVFSSQVTRLGTTALAAHSLALTAEQAFYIPGYGMQAAAATLCGNALGARDGGDRVDPVPLPGVHDVPLHAGRAGHRAWAERAADRGRVRARLWRLDHPGGRVRRHRGHAHAAGDLHRHDVGRADSCDLCLRQLAAPGAHGGVVLHGCRQRRPRRAALCALRPRAVEAVRRPGGGRLTAPKRRKKPCGCRAFFV